MFGRHLTGAGLSPLQTGVIKGGSGGNNLAITAIGTGQSTGYAIADSVNVFTTVNTTVNSAVLPVCDIGDFVQCANMTSKAMNIYGNSANGATGDTIQNGSANAAFTLNSNKSALFRRYSTTAWFAILSS